MSELVDRAIVFATEKHAGQVRKFGATPYILHPLEVAVILSTLTGDENTIAAGLLHDTVEDTGTEPEEIREAFGPRVYALVLSETEDKSVNRSPSETWMERKQDSLLVLEHTHDLEVKKMWLADKLSNMRSFYRVQLEMGDALWERLHQKDKAMHAWYYRTIADYTADLSETLAHQEYVSLLLKVFGGENNG